MFDIVFHCIVLCSIALYCVVLYCIVLQEQRRYEGAAELRGAQGVLDIVLNSTVLYCIVLQEQRRYEGAAELRGAQGVLDIVLNSIVLYCMTGAATIRRCCRTPWCSGSFGHCIEVRCIPLQCIVLYSIVLYCIPLHCIVLYDRSSNDMKVLQNSVVLGESANVGEPGFQWVKELEQSYYFPRSLPLSWDQ